MTQPTAHIDNEALIAALRRNDQEAVNRAYRIVFGSEVGRMVLTHQLSMAGFGHVRGPSLPGEDARYFDGRCDHALAILQKAGFDALSAAHAVTSDSLQGGTDDGSSGQHGDGGHRFGGSDQNYDPD